MQHATGLLGQVPLEWRVEWHCRVEGGAVGRESQKERDRHDLDVKWLARKPSAAWGRLPFAHTLA